MSCPDIDGALVGGASLVGEKFGRIINFTKK
jgi:triosephosphate isomerase